MRAVVLDTGGVTVDADYPVPTPANSEVLVRVIRAGICETDLQLMQGYMGFTGVLGHEFVGIAEDGPLEGKRVVGEINCSCHRCNTCRDGLPNHCPNRTVIGILNHDGVFADYIAIPAGNLHWVPDELSTDEAVFTEPLAAAFQIPVQVPLKQYDRVVVLGDGRLGNLCAQVLKLHGCQVLVVGKHPSKLALLDQLDIETVLLTDIQPDRGADIVVDCTGSTTGLPTAIPFVKPRGTIVLKTTVAAEQTMSMAPLVIDEISLIGSRCGPFQDALDALRAKQIDVLPLISNRYPLNDAAQALQDAQSSPVLKNLLDIDASIA